MKFDKGKNILICLLAMLCALPAMAGPVDGTRAADAARAFFQRDRNRALRLAPVERVMLDRAPLTKAGETSPAYYIFNRQGGGFVIIGGDDACAPVLGYSFTGRFGTGDDMPDGLRSWLEDLEAQVAIARSEGAPATQAFAQAWSELFVPTKGGVEGFVPEIKHNTPIWGQNEPFNRLAPTVNGKKAVAGCVPLAMSMLCRFFTYPLNGTGTLPSYTYTPESTGTQQTIDGYDLGYPYDWQNMRMEYAENYSEAEADAVARLVYDCGVMAQVTFDSETSGTIFTMARKAVEHLGFDKSMMGVYRSYYSDAKWLELLKTELQSHPVLYSARREEGGHAFLVDGYDKNGYLSINWGWKGDSNGYFRLEAFSPNAQRQYLYKHAAILGLKPDAGGQTKEFLYMMSGTSSSGTVFHGLEASGPVVARQDFTMKVGGMCNGGNEYFEGYFILALCDSQGNIKDWVCGSQYIEPLQPRYWRGFTSVSCRMNQYPQEGDMIKAFYRSSKWGDDDWQEFLYDKTDGTNVSVPVFDNQTLAQATTVSYSTTVGEMTVETKDHVTWSLTAANGTSMAEYVTYSVTTMTIRAGDMPKGTYTLTLKRGSDQVKLTLKMGKK